MTHRRNAVRDASVPTTPNDEIAVRSMPRAFLRCVAKRARPADTDGAREQALRLARDLHDGLVQDLAAIALQVDSAAKWIASDPDAAHVRLQEVAESIAAAQEDVASLVGRLRSGTLDAGVGGELAATLEKLCTRVEVARGLRVVLRVHGPCTVSRSLAYNAYRIVQEALANAARHANARTARVDVATSAHGVRIAVSDDGHGFAFRGRYDLATLVAKNLGPASLRDRVAALNGRMVVTSSAAGAKLEIALPAEPVAAIPEARYA